MKDFAEHLSDTLTSDSSTPNNLAPNDLTTDQTDTQISSPATTNSSRYFFDNENRAEVLQKLSHLTDFTNLVLFIQGVEGVGKTSLAKQCVALAQNNWRTCYFSARTHTTEQEIIKHIAQSFQLKPNADNSEFGDVKTISEQIDGLKHTGETAILLIDDVEALHPSLIPMLATLISHQIGSSPLVRLLVFGQTLPEQLLHIIPREEGQSTLKHLPLFPLTLRETGDYMSFRLKILELENHPLFDDSQVRNIHLNSSGIPKNINTLSDELLSTLSIDAISTPINQKKTNSIYFTRTALIVTTIILTLILVLATIDSEDDKDNNLIPLEIPQTNSHQENQPGLISSEPSNHKSDSLIHQRQANLNSDKQLSDTEQKSLLKNNADEINETGLPDVFIEEELIDESIDNVNTPISQAATNIDFNESRISTENLTQPSHQKPESPSLSWLQSEPSSNYTIQLIATSKESSAIEFIRTHGIEEKAKIIKTVRQKKDWFVILYQSYPTSEKAKVGRNALSNALKKTKPWIRTIKSVKAQLPSD